MNQWAATLVLALLAYLTEAGKNDTLEEEPQGSRILFLYPFATKSHSIFFRAITKALVDEGNHVTVVSPFRSTVEGGEVREVLVREGDVSGITTDHFQGHRLQATIDVAAAAPDLCSDMLAKPVVQELLKEEFDVALLSVVYSDCFLSLVFLLKVPYIWVCPTGMMSVLAEYAGSPQFPSFVGTKMTSFQHPLTFYQRAISTFTDTSLSVFHRYFSVSRIENVCRQRGLCPREMPSFIDMLHNASLVIINSVRPLEVPPRPTVPVEVYCGGIHCRPAQPLPEDLEEWVRGAGEAGFIFFSLGSVVQPSSMPERARAALLEAFSTLDQRVIWKWDQDTMDDLPPNVRLGKWLPQQDILGDPRLRLFITHGGLMSTMEASCKGVPVLGLPIFLDQHSNMQEAQAQGWGRYVDWDELTSKRLRHTIVEVMGDARMGEEAKRRADLIHDQPMTPGRTVAYWVHYVIRHEGASHLRCPAMSLPWYQLYNVDVWLAAAAVLLLTLYITVKLLLTVCSYLCCYSVTKRKQD